MMQQKTVVIFIGFMICMNVVYGCGSLKTPHLEKQYYDLNLDMQRSSNYINKGGSLLVKEFSINPTFDSHCLVYRIDKNEYVYDYYNEFVYYPAKIISDKIAETLYGSAYFISALTKEQVDIKYRLSGKILQLYGDFQDSNAPKAIIEIRIILEEKRDKIFQKVISNTYRGSEAISSAAPDDLFEGWNSGLSKNIIQFINEFAVLIKED